MKKGQLLFGLIFFYSLAISQKCDPAKLPIVFVHGFLGSGNLMPTFKAVPFMNGIDLLLDAKEKEPIHIYFNGRNYLLPKRKSASEGVMVFVLN